jgi:hypothetical protein
VQNTYGYWSEWGSYLFTVATSEPTPAAITSIAQVGSGLAIEVSYSTPKCIIYRRTGDADFISVAELVGDEEWTDYTVASGVQYEYFARAVAGDFAFADSEPATGTALLDCTYIAPTSDLSNPVSFNRRFASGAGRTVSYAKSKSLRKLAGREYSAVETDGTKERTISLNYFIAYDELADLEALVDAGAVLYRDNKGAAMYATIDGFTAVEDVDGYDVSFIARQIDWQESGELA